MRKLALALVPLILLACGREPVAPGADPASSFADAHTISNEFDVPFTRTISAACLDEDVFVDGVIHLLITETYSASGHYSFKLLGQPQDLWGVGVTSGLPWKFAGATNWTINVQLAGFPYAETFVDRFHVVGPRGSQYNLEELLKVTINGVGDVVLQFDDNAEECK